MIEVSHLVKEFKIPVQKKGRFGLYLLVLVRVHKKCPFQ